MRKSLTQLESIRTTAFVSFDSPEKDMKKRGKILRVPGTGPGLLMIEGRQYRFYLEGVWKSEVPPRPGLAVDVSLDRVGEILAMTPAAESELRAEQAAPSVDTAKAAPVNILRKIAAKCGMPGLLRR